MAIREDQKLQVQEATDIVALIGEHVALHKKGREWVAVCPFHDDHRPSMTISPVKQIFKCFSCGAGGDVFSWLTRYQRMTFPEALAHLAQRAGIQLQRTASTDQDGSAGASQDNRRPLLEASARALECFRAFLRHAEHGAAARQYMEQRRILPDSIEGFQIGCAPDRWDGLLTMIRRNDWDIDAFDRAGALTKRSSGDGHYDRFRNRLIFPICDDIGRPIAFGGRRLSEEDEPKYLNSPETVLFNKSATLYGLHLSKQQIIAQRTAVVVEGYTDVIACHQAGLKNVVATLGTALTEQHARQLRRYADKVVLIFDPDEAGQQAADRAVEAFLSGDLDVAVAVLPQMLDPAALLAEPDGLARWRLAVDQATDALEFQFQRVRGQLEETATISGRQRIAEEHIRRLASLGLNRQGPIRRSMIVQKLAQMLHLSEPQVNALLKQKGTGQHPRRVDGEQVTDNRQEPICQGKDEVASTDSAPRINALRRAEQQLIGALLRQPALFHQTLDDGRTLRDAVKPRDFVTHERKQLYEQVYSRLSRDDGLSLRALVADLGSAHEQDLVDLATGAEAEMEKLCASDEERLVVALRGAAETIRGYHQDQDYARMRGQLLSDQGSDQGSELPGDRVDTAAGNVHGADGRDGLLREMVQQRRANRRPSSIGRSRSP